MTAGTFVRPPTGHGEIDDRCAGGSNKRRGDETPSGTGVAAPLFNDATALLLFAGVLAVQSGGLSVGVELGLALAVPGGLVFGIASAVLLRRQDRFGAGTFGGTLLQFVASALVWVVAERLYLSAVLAVAAFAMTLARNAEFAVAPRVRIHSYAIWGIAVFVLNVFAFLLMGMQVRTIPADMAPAISARR